MRLIPTSVTQRMVDPNDPTGGMTLDALMARQKALSQAAPEAPRQIASPWQGAAFMANSFVNSLQQKQAQEQEAAGRQQLAQTMAGINYDTGATPEQTASLMQLDPDTGMKFIADAMSARRAERERALTQDAQLAEEGRANAEWTRRHKLEAEAKGAWVTDPNDPTKMSNPATGEIKYIKPTDRWVDDPQVPGAQINEATGERKYPPSKGISIDKDGNIQIGGPSGGAKPLTEQISKGLEFYTSAASAGAMLDTGIDTALTQAGPRIAESVAGSGPANYVATPEYRQAKTQADAFINAVLRRESGAQITDPEYDRAFALYLPRPGDDEQTIALKRRNRATKLSAIKNGIGSAEAPTLELIEQTANEAAAGTAPASPAATTTAPPEAAPAASEPLPAPADGKFVVGQKYIDDNGKVATYLGGDTSKPASWRF